MDLKSKCLNNTNEILTWLKFIQKGFSSNKDIMHSCKDMFSFFDEDFYIKNNSKIENRLKNILKGLNEEYFEIMKREEIGILSIFDKIYPIQLKNIPNPPLFIYYQGEIQNLEKDLLAIVGTRQNTIYGQNYTRQLIEELKEYDIVTLSGMALGIDSLAHKYSIENDIKTIAVLGSGFLNIYPYQNKGLYKEILKNQGLILSEFPPDFKPTKWSFPMRNRIIAGLCKGLVVIESFKKGGSLITAEQVFLNDKDIYAFPSFSNIESFEGNLNLIKENKAKLITSAKDIVEDLNLDRRKNG